MIQEVQAAGCRLRAKLMPIAQLRISTFEVERWTLNVALILPLLLASCRNQPPAPPPSGVPTPAPVSVPQPQQHVINGDAAPPAPADVADERAVDAPAADGSASAAPPTTVAGAPIVQSIHAFMYQLQMPLGANSRDDRFWKLVDEDVVDPDVAADLYRNGLRAGRAYIASWPAFLKVLTDEGANTVSTNGIVAQPSFDDAQLPMSPWLSEEDLFIFNEHGLTGRTFDDCRNMLSMAFEWAPRKAHTIRLTICPMVQSNKGTKRDNFYDLHLSVDIAPSEFFVLGTSPETVDTNRVGSRFLTRNGPNSRLEQVLIFVGDPGPLQDMKFHRPSTGKQP